MKSLVVLLLLSSVLWALPKEVQKYREDLFLNHPSLKAVEQELIQSRSEQKLATRLPDPIVGASIALSPVETRIGPQRGALSISQKLLFPSLLRAKKATATMREPLLRTIRESQKAALVAEMLTYMTELYEVDKKRTLYSEYNQLIKARIDIVESRYITSSTSRRAVISAELELIRNEDKLKKLSKKQEDIQISFNALMGYAPKDTVHLPTTLLELNRASIAQLDNLNPQLQLFDRKIAIAQERSKLEKSSLFPGLTVGGKYIFNGESEMNPAPEESGKDAFQIFISAPLPLSKKKNSARISIHEQSVQRLKAEKEAVHRRVTQKIETLQITLTELERTISLSTKEIIPKLEELRENSMELYSTGTLRFDELILIERELLMERVILLSAQASLVKTTIEINKLLGETYEADK